METDDLEHLGFEVAEVWHDISTTSLAEAIFCFPVDTSSLSIAPPDFKRGLNMSNLGPAYPLKPFPLPGNLSNLLSLTEPIEPFQLLSRLLSRFTTYYHVYAIGHFYRFRAPQPSPWLEVLRESLESLDD